MCLLLDSEYFYRNSSLSNFGPQPLDDLERDFIWHWFHKLDLKKAYSTVTGCYQKPQELWKVNSIVFECKAYKTLLSWNLKPSIVN